MKPDARKRAYRALRALRDVRLWIFAAGAVLSILRVLGVL